jgi:RNA polymerase sigma-70 factor (family 1)
MINKTLSDHELWSAILNDDSQAFAALYDRYWLRLYKTASHYIKDSDACEEIVHDVFIIIWNKRRSLKIEHFSSYLNAITRYEVFRHIKVAKMSKLEYNENYTDESKNYAFNLGQLRLNELDLENTLDGYLQQLPKRCRQIFYMSKIQQLNNDEIARELGISKHTVENQLTYALKYLKASIKDLSILGILLLLWS